MKGYIYYRCSTVGCPTTCLREETIEQAVTTVLLATILGEREADLIKSDLAASHAEAQAVAEKRRIALTEALSAANARLKRLTSLLVEGAIDTDAYSEARDAITKERTNIELDLATGAAKDDMLVQQALRIAELARDPAALYVKGSVDAKRRLLQIVMSNCIANGKTLEFSLREPFCTIANRQRQQRCGPHCHTPLTGDENLTSGENLTFSATEFIELSAGIPPELLDTFELPDSEDSTV
jgi:hypothetical protein